MTPGLYVHVPFCLTRCSYCDFFSVARGSVAQKERWSRTVLAEARLHAPGWNTFDTLYLGGGTPSQLPLEILAHLLRGLQDTLSFAANVEHTIEANPDDTTGPWLAEVRQLGVGRISLGVQSFDDAALTLLGRRHSGEQAREAIRGARQAGFDNLGLDLIFGLPGQTIHNWRATLEEALSFEPDHLSCYQLTLERATPLAKRHQQTPLALPDEETARALFLFTAETLSKAGFEHYEVSNFARTPALRSRHNQKYWDHTPYLGLGPGAHSFQGRRRWWNSRDLSAWQDAVAAGQRPEAELLTDDQLTLERLLLGFRTAAGVPLSLLRALPRGDRDLDALVGEGLLHLEGDHAVPTLQGLLMADGLPLRFVGLPNVKSA